MRWSTNWATWSSRCHWHSSFLLPFPWNLPTTSTGQRKPFKQLKTDLPVPRWNSLVQVLSKLIKFWRAQCFPRFSPATAPATVLSGLLDNLSPYRLPHTRRVFVTELQIFLSGWNRVKICRAISLSHTSRFFCRNLPHWRLGLSQPKFKMAPIPQMWL